LIFLISVDDTDNLIFCNLKDYFIKIKSYHSLRPFYRSLKKLHEFASVRVELVVGRSPTQLARADLALFTTCLSTNSWEACVSWFVHGFGGSIFWLSLIRWTPSRKKNHH